MKRITIATAIFVLSTAALELAFRHLAHATFFWHKLPAFDFVYGVLGCGLIVFGSKWVGHKFVQRDVNYYDDRPDQRDQLDH
ncbi:MAG: hypothetical protein E2P02_28795 [Acidobacteria bacterium]|nr:MAG: hypothetical protein E2P02_28795 [Acidobacteriota bacterium]